MTGVGQQPTKRPIVCLGQDADRLAEYQQGWSVVDIFRPNGDPAPGVVTTHDEFAISWTKEEAIAKVDRLLATNTEAEARQLFTLCSQNQWSYARAKRELADGAWRSKVTPILYRPFDTRWTIWDSNVAVHRRERANNHLLHKDLGLLIPKQTKDDWGCLVTEIPAAHKSASVFDPTSIIPLWIYHNSKSDLFGHKDEGKTANLSTDFIHYLCKNTGKEGSSPEAIFAYVYAVLYSPGYRKRYADSLRRDFPRIPFTGSLALFQQLAALGRELIDLHLLHRSLPVITAYPKAGSNRVDKIDFRPDRDIPEQGRVQINSVQYFEGMPTEVWEYTIGGYQVANKWLKDRKGRLLTFDELQHYGRVIAVLSDTIRLQTEIDAVIGDWPIA
jgi:predicted helicase